MSEKKKRKTIYKKTIKRQTRRKSRRKSKAQHPKAKAADNKLVSLLLAFSVTFSKLSPLFLPFIQHSQNADTRLNYIISPPPPPPIHSNAIASRNPHYFIRTSILTPDQISKTFINHQLTQRLALAMALHSTAFCFTGAVSSYSHSSVKLGTHPTIKASSPLPRLNVRGGCFILNLLFIYLC